ncbi:MAG: hypothetical protein AMXMBFR31_23700 [Candidatus Desulfobacillus denitrificans]
MKTSSRQTYTQMLQPVHADASKTTGWPGVVAFGVAYTVCGAPFPAGVSAAGVAVGIFVVSKDASPHLALPCLAACQILGRSGPDPCPHKRGQRGAR